MAIMFLSRSQSSYECSRISLEQLHSRWRDTLDVGTRTGDSVAVKHLESAVGLYLKRVCRDHDVADVVQVGIEQTLIIIK